MSIGILPDRERRHLLQFHVAPQLAYGARMAWAGGLMGTGLVLQGVLGVGGPGWALAVGVPFLFAGNLLLLVRGYNLQPGYGVVAGRWEKTTRDRFQAVRQLERDVRGWDETFADITCVSGVVSLVVLGLVLAGISLALMAKSRTEIWGLVFAVDAVVLLLPHWVTGTRRGWRPVGLRQQVDAIETALETIERYEEPPRQIQPMLELASGEAGDRGTPIGARAFVRFPDGPEDFLGLQFQVALNDVQGTRYPYLYAVVVARESFDLLRRHARVVEDGLEGLTVESSSEGEVEVIVIRQPTTRTSGYHTNRRAVEDLARAAWAAVTAILQSASTPDSVGPA